ncbi:hypothetical protein XU18_4722 [Perkinsela sp. CCAP 1560/4]|nr:hypothetical protein XU18_4722 [Perkinsela sp. CCAP 1560/4]|eukprot:KNH00522.1 hypothetical protein XU18_4722 [Perkinsela sp. CCAP 1560/4]
MTIKLMVSRSLASLTRACQRKILSWSLSVLSNVILKICSARRGIQ